MRQVPSKAQRHAAITGGDEGTTLIEVLVVMAILALVAAVALPSVRLPDRVHSLRSIAADIAGRLRAARAIAISENREVAFAFDAETRAYTVEGTGTPQPLPATIEISITTAREFVRDAQDVKVLFFADGTSSGGAIKLVEARQSVTITIAWLTAAIEISWGSP
jgi:general secretion pathway protein H